jgi:hypothetical protein
VTAEKTKQATTREGLGHHVLFGEEKDGRRPRLRLARSARGFDDPAKFKPMIAFRMLRATKASATRSVPLAHPLDVPEGFENAAAIGFGEKLCNLDFDCGGHAGAVGLHAPMAQDSTVLNVRVDATGAYAGFDGLPGRNSVTGNIEVIGGRIGLINRGSIAGAVVVGARLIDQTETAIAHTDFSPLVVTGFEIRRAGGPGLKIQPHDHTSNAALSLIDGSIDVKDSPVAIDNAAGKTIYVRPAAFPAYRPVLIDSTTEPLAIYGLNSESPYEPARNERFGMTNEQWLDRYALEANTEVRRAANVRIYGAKREGASPSILVRDSRNVAVYSTGAMRNPVHPGLGGYIQFRGENRDLMVAVALVQAVKTLQPGRRQPLLRVESQSSALLEILWPDSLAIFKQGEIDDGPFR